MRSPAPGRAALWWPTSPRGSGRSGPSCPPSATPPPSSWSKWGYGEWTQETDRPGYTLSRTLSQSDQSSNEKYCCLQNLINLHARFTVTSVSQNFTFNASHLAATWTSDNWGPLTQGQWSTCNFSHKSIFLQIIDKYKRLYRHNGKEIEQTMALHFTDRCYPNSTLKVDTRLYTSYSLWSLSLPLLQLYN